MNPFDLRGPEFLLFYAIVATAVVAAIHFRRRIREDADKRPLPKIEDPYLIAFLRGGKQAAIETAVVSLVDRKRILVENDQMVAGAPQGVDHPLEQALLKELATARKATQAGQLRCEESLQGYETYLLKNGLLPDGNQKAARLRDTALACHLLAAVALTKIAVAIARGRTNILFLIILMVVSIVIAIAVANPRLTSRGRRTVDHLRGLLARLQVRATSLRPNHDTQDLVLLAAVFGVMAVPETAMPQRAMLYPQSTSSGSDSGDSSSSCGSSCGGGCGGGCGGCGS